MLRTIGCWRVAGVKTLTKSRQCEGFCPASERWSQHPVTVQRLTFRSRPARNFAILFAPCMLQGAQKLQPRRKRFVQATAANASAPVLCKVDEASCEVEVVSGIARLQTGTGSSKSLYLTLLASRPQESSRKHALEVDCACPYLHGILANQRSPVSADGCRSWSLPIWIGQSSEPFTHSCRRASDAAGALTRCTRSGMVVPGPRVYDLVLPTTSLQV